MEITKYRFKEAVPVWKKGAENEMNVWLCLRAFVSKAQETVLHTAGSSCYNVRVNGRFVAFGPARSAHGFHRVDEIDLSSYCDKEENILTITAIGYNINSFYHIKQPSFICAELLADGTPVAVTGKSGFECREVAEHEQKAFKFSYQRTFIEIYNYDAAYRDFETKRDASFIPVTLTETESKVFIPRGCPLNTYEMIPAETVCYRGTYRIGDHKDELKYSRQISELGPMQLGYPISEVTTDCVLLARNIETLTRESTAEQADAFSVEDGHYAVARMKCNTTGQFCMELTCESDCELLLTFSEKEEPADREWAQPLDPVDFRHMGVYSIVLWKLKKGTYTLSTAEPYTAMFVKFLPIGGAVTVRRFSMNYFGADKPDVFYNGNDEKLSLIFDAAVETFRQNTFTVFMDCPSRERAGWLCDSFFTGRVEKVLTGKSIIEHNFLENFLLPDSYPKIDAGMLPMCYPGDHFNGSFIPNWAMWYVIELSEYLTRSGDRTLVEAAREKVYNLVHYFLPFENEDGLLEKLDRWIFVEWSKSNELTQDVNFPTNMLYALMLECVDKLYGDKKAKKKAAAIKKTINRLSYNGEFYVDNMVRGRGGRLAPTGITTETCQYYAFFCGVATKETRPELWQKLLSDFGFARIADNNWPNFREEAKYKNVYPSNMFIGIYLRLELLYRYGEKDRLVEDIKGYFYNMAKTTGTLWESMLSSASTNHGFASHVLYWMDGLGLLGRK